MLLAGLLALVLGGQQATSQTFAVGKFTELACKDVSNFFIVDVELSDGKVHPFLLDTGCNTAGLINKKLATSLGNPDDLAPCFLKLRDGTKLAFYAAPVDAKILDPGVFIAPIDGIVGLGILSAFQLKIDYGQQKAWLRLALSAESEAQNAAALSETFDKGLSKEVSSVPLKKTAIGWFYIEASVNQTTTRLVLDTGANHLSMDPDRLKRLKCDKVIETKIVSYKGPVDSDIYIAPSLTIGGSRLYWPVFRSKPDEPSDGDGVIGCPLLPSLQVLLDFPGKRLFFRKPSQPDLVNLAVRQYFNDPIVIHNGILRMDWSNSDPNHPGLNRAPIVQVQDVPGIDWTKLMLAWTQGDAKVYAKLLAVYSDIATKESLKVSVDGHRLDYPLPPAKIDKQ